MQTSEDGIAAIKRREGFTPKPANDNGRLMWGHGHDQRPGERIPVSVDLVEADSILRADLATDYEPHVNALASWANQNQFDALVSFTYNLGAISLATMLHHGAAAVPVQILAWHYEHKNGQLVSNDGLLARRKDELAQYERT